MSTGAAGDLVAAARSGLLEATLAVRPDDRFVRAHVVALRAAAAVLAARTRPAGTDRGRPHDVWSLLPAVAPELSEWAEFFAAVAGKRAAVEAGVEHVVTAREADDLLRDAATFLALVESSPRVRSRAAGSRGVRARSGSA